MSQESTHSVETVLVDSAPTDLMETQAAPEAAEVETPEPEIEAKPEPKKPEDDKFAAKFAALARRDKAAKQREAQLAAKEAALEKRMAELEARMAPKPEAQAEEEDFETRLMRNPFKALEEKGLSYEELTKSALEGGKLPEHIKEKLLMQEMEKKFKGSFGKQIEELEKKLAAKEEQEKKQLEEQSAKAQEQQIAQFKSSIKAAIEAQKETFELLADEGEDGIETVYAVIAQDAQAKADAAKEEGEEWDGSDMMTIEEAAQKVEEHFLNLAKKKVNLNKVKGLLQPPTPPAQAKTEAKPASMTLSNQTQQAQGQKKPFLSNEESAREAAKLIKWNT